jgi:hypothetical protein
LPQKPKTITTTNSLSYSLNNSLSTKKTHMHNLVAFSAISRAPSKHNTL